MPKITRIGKTGKTRKTERIARTGKTAKNNGITLGKKQNPHFKSKLVSSLVQLLMTVKLYHWQTHSFAQHKATDELYENLNSNVDKFVEVFLGKDGSRIENMENALLLYNFAEEQSFKKRIYEFRKMLQGLSSYFSPKEDSDLLTIRDELLINLNQFLYLMTFH